MSPDTDPTNASSSNPPVSRFGSPESLDTLLTCLAARERRVALQCLSERAGPMVVDELAKNVAEQVAADSTDRSAKELKVEIVVSLVHTHLPKMRDAEVVDVDHETNTVRPGEQFETATALMAEV